jgi:L-iditol 2-dehydrogenase
VKSLTSFLYGPNDLRLIEVDVPEPKHGEVVVKVRAAGICGSDMECFLGRSKEGRYDLGPYTPGHEWSGEIVAVGQSVSTLAMGDKVTGDCVISCNRCNICKEGINSACCTNMREAGFMPNAPGGMGQYLVTEEQFCHKLPESMSFEQGALVECCSIPYYSIWGRDGYVSSVDDMVVFGAGPIGLFAASIGRAAGARVTVIDPLEHRRTMAKDIVGASAVLDPISQDVKEEVMRFTGGEGATLIVECSGTDQAIATTVEIARAHARLRFIGHCVRRVPMDMELVIWKGLNLQGSPGSPLFFPKTIKFMSRLEGIIDYNRFITHRFPLEKVAEAFSTAIVRKEEAIKVMLLMD